MITLLELLVNTYLKVFLNSFKKAGFDLSKPYELAIFLLFLPFLVINIGAINTKRDRLI